MIAVNALDLSDIVVAILNCGQIATITSKIANQKRLAYFLLATVLAIGDILPTIQDDRGIIGKVYWSKVKEPKNFRKCSKIWLKWSDLFS